MHLTRLLRSNCMTMALLVMPGMIMAAQTKPCEPGTPTPESEAWNFPSEASNLLKEVAADAIQVRDRADELRMFVANTHLSWESHAEELSQIKQEVNDMGAKLCRLEAIRRVAEPWQQQAIDRAAALIPGMANNAEEAIHYLNANHEHLWGPTYEQYASNLFREGRQLSHRIQDYERLARVRQTEKRLEKYLGVNAGA